MIKTLVTVAVLGSVGGFAGLAMAQGKQGEAIGNDISLQAKLEAQCAHRRIMPPDPRDDCARQLRDAQVGYGGGVSQQLELQPSRWCRTWKWRRTWEWARTWKWGREWEGRWERRPLIAVFLAHRNSGLTRATSV